MGAAVEESNVRQALEAARMAQVAQEARARLEENARQFDTEAELQKRRIEQSARLEMHRAEISKAYHDAQLGIARDRLDETRKINEEKAISAARQALAKNRLDEMIRGGQDPVRSALSLSGDLAMPGASIASLAKAAQPQIPPTLNTQTKDGETYYQSGSRGWVHVPRIRDIPEGTLTQKEREQLRTARKDLDMATKDLESWRTRIDLETDPSSIRDEKLRKIAEQRRAEAQRVVDRAKSARETIDRLSGSGAGGQYQRVPPVAERVEGKVYSSPKGLFVWRGDHWESYKEEEPDTAEE